MSIDEISNPIFQKYEHTSKIKNRDYHLSVPITEDVSLTVNFKKYPQSPKVVLVKNDRKKFKLNNILSHLRDWNEKKPFKIVNVIDEVFLLVNSILNRQIPFTETCFQDLITICKDSHPRKIQGVLSVNKGKVSELIIPAVRCVEPDRLNYVNLTPICSLPFDLSYEGTFISRPDGDISMNDKLRQVLRKKRFTILLGYPYDDPTKVKLLDQSGKELSYIILSD